MENNNILRILQKLQQLDEETLKKLDTTLDACVIVQNLKKVTSNKKIEQVL